MIQIDELTKYYGDRRALGPVSATIEFGEVVGLLGLNGAGKTTTLRVLACDLLPSGGTVRVDGLDVVESPHEVRARVGYLPDTPPLYTEMRVGEYLAFAAELRDVPRRDVAARVSEALEKTDLGVVRGELISTLSHGYKQRVGIAQAIVHKPRLLVLDEPISGLDPKQIVEMRALIRGLAGEHTILLSSHILSEISETCDRLFVIQDGLIAASGTEAELTERIGKSVVVEIVCRGSAERAEEAARRVPAVREVGARADGELVTLTVEADEDVREAVARALVEAGLGLLELRRASVELENVFLALAGGAKASPAAEPAAEADEEGEAE